MRAGSPRRAVSSRVPRSRPRRNEAARLVEVPVLATEQNPAGLGGNLPEIAALASRTFSKNFFDGTREGAFDGFLPDDGRTVVVAGCEAHVCVLQTVLGLRAKGQPVALVRDAVGSRDPLNRDAALERAKAHGAELVTTEMVVFEWLETSDHPHFREALRLVK